MLHIRLGFVRGWRVVCQRLLWRIGEVRSFGDVDLFQESVIEALLTRYDRVRSSLSRHLLCYLSSHENPPEAAVDSNDDILSQGQDRLG